MNSFFWKIVSLYIQSKLLVLFFSKKKSDSRKNYSIFRKLQMVLGRFFIFCFFFVKMGLAICAYLYSATSVNDHVMTSQEYTKVEQVKA